MRARSFFTLTIPRLTQSCHRDQPPRPIIDKNGLVVAVVVGAPKSSDWESIHQAAHELLLDSAQRCHFEKASKVNRRGNFGALNVGIAYGNGLQVRTFIFYHAALFCRPPDDSSGSR